MRGERIRKIAGCRGCDSKITFTRFPWLEQQCRPRQGAKRLERLSTRWRRELLLTRFRCLLEHGRSDKYQY